MSQRAYLSSKDIKREELGILLQLDELCRTHGLRYSLCGGSLLGAIRHKGFIPWDDDIDVSMPRPDMDRLINIWLKGGLPAGYSLEIMSGDSLRPVFVKLVNEKICLKERYAEGFNHLWVDIIPIDGMPADEGGAARLEARAARLRRLFLLSGADKNDGTTAFKKVFKKAAVPVMGALGSRRRLGRALDGLGRKIPFGSTGYAGCVTWGLYGAGERYKDDAFDRVVMVEFEGHEFPSIYCWDEYLTGIYGDYMQLPPEGERKTHELEVWWDQQ